jgi:hypothetical protein
MRHSNPDRPLASKTIRLQKTRIACRACTTHAGEKGLRNFRGSDRSYLNATQHLIEAASIRTATVPARFRT